MTSNPLETLQQLAMSNAAARVLERYRLDYCCAGNRTLAESCRTAGISVEEVVAALDAEPRDSDGVIDPGWLSLRELIRHIVDTHHAFTRAELLRIGGLLDKVIARHAPSHPELRQVGERFAELTADLVPHLLKEEQVLFPYIEDLERHLSGDGAAAPRACFGAVGDPIRRMEEEHRTVGGLLGAIRRLTDDFTVPADGCASYRNVYAALASLETDLMRHIHLENAVLFPRAEALAGTVA